MLEVGRVRGSQTKVALGYYIEILPNSAQSGVLGG